MKPVGSSGFGRAADLGPLFLRLGIGAVFAWHGWLKLDGGVDAYAGFLTSLDIPAPEIMGWLQIAAECIGGLLLIAGLLTRLVTIPLIVVMIGVIWLVKAEVGFIVPDVAGFELAVSLLSGLLGILFIGPGRISLDGILGMEAGAKHVEGNHRALAAA
jgi:putative oxidoreductase